MLKSVSHNMEIPKQVKSLFNRQPLVSVATCDDNGMPNVVPIYWKKILTDSRILLIDNYMGTTRLNLLKNPKICLSFWDSQTEESYKLKGIAKYHFKGNVYDLGKAFIQSIKPGRIPRGIVEVKVKEIYTLTPGPNAGKKLVLANRNSKKI
jgi:uncharacterized protein